MPRTSVRAHPRKKPRGGITGVRKHQRTLVPITTVVPYRVTPEVIKIELPTEEYDITQAAAIAEGGRDIVAHDDGNFVNQRTHQQSRYSADAAETSDGFGNVGLYDKETGGFRNLFAGSYKEARALASAINAGKIRPVDGFLH